MHHFQAKNISIGYKDKPLFSNLNFELKTGVLTSLLGSNGIGKSTLLKTISRLIPLQKGELLLNGQSIFDLSNAQFSQQISMVLTDKEVHRDLKVRSEERRVGKECRS